MFDIVAFFFGLINAGTFNIYSALFVIAFIVWEIPRSVKLMDEEYTSGVYPPEGRITDFFLLVVGLAAIAFMYSGSNMAHILNFLKHPTFMLFFIPMLVAVPLMILFGFFKRFFSRMEKGKSITVYLVHVLLDLAHTLFFLSLSILLIPVAGLLLFGGYQ